MDTKERIQAIWSDIYNKVSLTGNALDQIRQVFTAHLKDVEKQDNLEDSE